MKNTRLTPKGFGFLALLAVLILLLIISLTMCGKQAEDVPAPETTSAPVLSVTEQSTVAAAAAAETTATAAATETTAAPTAAVTEATEEETEATEETAAATTVPSESTATEPEEKEPEYFDVPYPGTPENPYVEVVKAYPMDVESVYMAAAQEVSYLISGSAGSVVTVRDPGVTLTLEDGTVYTADPVTGEITVDLSKLGIDPMITLKNTTSASANCLVTLEEGLGGAGNPELLTAPGEIAVSLNPGDANGYHYLWTATTDGQVSLQVQQTAELQTAAEEDAPQETSPEEPAEEPPVLEILVTLGEEVLRLSEKDDGQLRFSVKRDAPVLIQVITMPRSDGSYPAIEETVAWSFQADEGTVENPKLLEDIGLIPVTLEENDQDGYHYLWTASRNGQLTLTPDEGLTVTATVADTVYQILEGETDLSFRVEQDQTVLIQALAVPAPQTEEQEKQEDQTDAEPQADADPLRPAVTGNITGTLLGDPGTPENPAQLTSIDALAVTLEAGDADGYTAQWTAPLDGTLTLSIPEATDTALEVRVTGPDNRQTLLAAEELALQLKKDDTVTLFFTAVADETGAYPAGSIALAGTFVDSPGTSAENPIQLTEATTTVAMEARQTLYFSGMVHEMIARVEDANGVSLHWEDQTAWGSQTGVAQLEFPASPEEGGQTPVLFSVTSKNEKNVTLVLSYPLGHAQNPAPLALGENRIQLREGDTDGYLLEWTAECDGFLTVSMDPDALWQFRIDDLTAGTEGRLHTSGDEAGCQETVEVLQGQQLLLMVRTLDREAPQAAPAGTLTVNASFLDPLLGTEAKPIHLDSTPGVTNTVTIPAGESLYFTAEAEGMLLNFTGSQVTLTHGSCDHTPEEGKLEFVCRGEHSLFEIRGSADSDQVCTLTFTYPQGHRKNPLELVLGENTAALSEGNLHGCAFVWTAARAGQLTVAMDPADNWQFLLCNETAGAEGVVHTSQDEPLVSGETVEVAAGDRVVLIVNSFDPKHPLQTPAAQIRFTATFVDPTLGMEENPVWLHQTDRITIPAGETMYCTARADGMILTLEGAGLRVVHNGQEYLPEQKVISFLCRGEGTFGHPVFAITNTTGAEGTYSICFDYPEGHFMAPAEAAAGENRADVSHNREHGFHYLWTADADGLLNITMAEGRDWSWSVSNLTAGTTGQTYSATDEQVVAEQSISVRAGDQIRIIVNTEEEDMLVTFTLAHVAQGERPE